MNKEELDKLFKKCFAKTLKKLAEEPDEVINYNELLKKYNSLLKEKLKQDKEIERLTAESTEWESKYYNEAKKVDRAIEIIDIYGCYNGITEDKLYSCLRGDNND